MHALSSQIVCLLIAQFGSDGGFQPDPPRLNQPTVRSVAPAAAEAPQFQQPVGNPDRAGQAVSKAAFTSTTVPVHSQTSLARAATLVDQFIGWDPKAIEGDSVTLLACVERAASTGQQAATVKAYWQLCTAVGRNTQAEQELVVLAGISPQFEIEQTQIHAAQRSAAARLAQVRVDLLAAQEQLVEAAQLPGQTLPLPADRPFVGKYQTRLNTMYKGRSVPRQVRRVDRALPFQLKLIEQRAEAVDANSRLVADLAPLYQQGQVPLSVLLGACKELTDQQSAFLQAVIAYNHQIATYSQSVVGTSLPAESLVSTLIRQPSAVAPSVFRDENVLPASARQPEPRVRRGTGRSTSETPGDVRPAFEPGVSPSGFDRQGFERKGFDRQEFERQAPAANGGPAFDPNSAFQINDGP